MNEGNKMKEEKETKTASDDLEEVKNIRNSWKKKYKMSTLPAWAQVQNKIIQQCKENLPEIDEETKKKITRELLLTLRCHSCERARSDACHFSICIRGLLSGKGVVQ
jgi:ribosomal protein L44E